MRFMLNITLPIEPFNSLVKNGTAGSTIEKILQTIKPEAVYFTEQDGQRGAIIIVNAKDPSEIPAIAEPFFLKFDANCKIRIVMSPEELAKSGIDNLGKKWGK